MLFAILCNDKADHLQLRMDTRPAHLEFLNGLGDRLKVAGPFLDANSKPNGSLVVIEADSQAEAETIAARDPYALAGLFERVTVRPWNWVFNNPASA
ncbi:YciI-like protein [Brucellaceae bacterium C25G]